MSTFEWSWPTFTAYNALVAAVLPAGPWLWRRLTEPGDPRPVEDPYQIAFMRGGWREALRVAAWSMLARGQLERRGDDGLVSTGEASGLVERAVLAAFRKPASWHALGALESRCGSLREELERTGHVLSAPRLLMRILVAAGAILLLLFVLHPWHVHPIPQPWRDFNAAILMFGMAGPILASLGPTSRALRTLAGLAKQHAALKAGAANLHPRSPELLRVAAVYGLGALPDTVARLRDVFFTSQPCTWIFDAAEYGTSQAEGSRSVEPGDTP